MINEKIYIPNYTQGNCAYIYNSDVIRVYESRPTYNSSINYKDYYIKSSYIYNEGTTQFGNYSNLPVCIQDSRITTDVYYRNDLPSILFIFVCFVFFGFWCPWKLITRIFRRWN